MLTKEFAQKSGLSEKQVRKIVQHLEERGYHLDKTEYRGREATDFKEEDVELFQEIAERVGQTNSYELAFEELEKEKDFLQVIVKEDTQQLPADQQLSNLFKELHNEINQMREERQILGQMVTQVHKQQEALTELHNKLETQLKSNSASMESLTEAQKQQTEQLSTTQKHLETQIEGQKALAHTIERNEKKGFLQRLFGG